VKNAKKAIWSYGHRNPQGIIFGNEPGDIIVHEHGPRGGDEINIIRERDSIREEPLLTRNYGWPIVSNGINYNGTSFTDLTSLEGTESPSYFWTPSIAPSGMTMLTSDIYDEWEGNLFIGSLRFRYLERIELIGNYVYKREKLLDRVGRVREVVQGPDGYLYVGIEKKGIFKIVPSKVLIKNDIQE
jgi:glucose/arabinose dehydrogenase